MTAAEPMAALMKRLTGDAPAVAVVGLGYVGLPLAVEFARSGATVVGLDVSEDRVKQVAAGDSPVGDIGDDELAAVVRSERGEPGGLFVTTEPDALADVDAVVICVPTPLRKTKDPDISHVVAASRQVARHARAGQLVVLESTTYPGTTEDILVPLLHEAGLEPGRDVAVAFSPERVDPGNATFGLRNTPKVVGGFTATCTDAAAALYDRACDTIVRVSSPTAAETVKLLENTFRNVNIGLVNEFAIACQRLGVDVWEVVDAAATKPFGFMPFRPGPGLGGHCIPVDPHYLAWKLRSLDYTFRFIELADAINSLMPQHVVGVAADALNEHEKPLKGSLVLVLGVTYKPDVADVRESPALAVIARLLEKGARVSFHDPCVSEVAVGERNLRSVELSEAALREADLVLIATDHGCYDPREICREARLVVDTRNATAPALADDPSLRTKIHRI